MLIDITQADIRLGRQKSLSGCPLALAVKRYTACNFVWVCGGVEIVVNKKKKDFTLSNEAAKFIRMFDAGLEVVPQVVELIEQETT